jgi:hypothetical protein
MRPTLRFMSMGPAVKDLQVLLNQRLPKLSPPLAVDGQFGHKTLARVKAFQMQLGLVVDGVVGPKTWAALEGKALPPAGNQGKAPAAPPPGGGSVGIFAGCQLRCTLGLAASSLQIPGPSRPATVSDAKPIVNINPFALCRSMANPQVALMNTGKFAGPSVLPGPCSPALSGVWTPGAQKAAPGTPAQSLIDRNSITVCAFGGIISIS